MRHLFLITILILILPAWAASARNDNSKDRMTVGINLVPIINERNLEIDFGYGFSQRWSVNGNICLDMKFLKRRIGDEEREHDETFAQMGQEESPREGKVFSEAGLTFRYWAKQMNRGVYFSIGSLVLEGNKIDCCAGIGYRMTIWKGLCLDMMLQTTVIRLYDRIKIGLSYVF